jgi:hypothetical protein
MLPLWAFVACSRVNFTFTFRGCHKCDVTQVVGPEGGGGGKEVGKKKTNTHFINAHIFF